MEANSTIIAAVFVFEKRLAEAEIDMFFAELKAGYKGYPKLLDIRIEARDALIERQ